MKKHLQRAFTLIELVVVMALVAVMAMLAAPGFRDFFNSSRLSSQTNALVAALYAAKNEAIKHNANTYLVPADGAAWSSGWMVFVDSDFSQSFNAGDVKVLEGEALPDNLTLSGTGTSNLAPPYVSFNGSGYPRKKDSTPENLTMSVKLNGLTGAAQLRGTRHIKLAITGRIRTCQPVSSSDNNCSGTAGAD